MRRLVAVLLGLLVASSVMVCVATPEPRSEAPAAGGARRDGATSPDVSCAITKTPLPIPVADAEMTPLCDSVYTEPGLTPEGVEQLWHAHETVVVES